MVFESQSCLRPSQSRAGTTLVKQAIASTVPTSIFNKIKGCKLASDIWNVLVKHCQDRSRMISIDLRRKFQDLRCGEHDNVRTHFERLSDMHEKLSSMGIDIANEDYAYTIIGSLPTSYDPIISTMITNTALNDKELPPKTIIDIVTDEYDRRTVKSRTKTKKD